MHINVQYETACKAVRNSEWFILYLCLCIRSGILRDKTMEDNFIYIPNYGKQYYNMKQHAKQLGIQNGLFYIYAFA